MHWPDEKYVRLYTRDTVEWDMLCWQARALWPLILRKVNRSGVLDLGRFGIVGLAKTVGLPPAIVEAGINGDNQEPGLIEDGCIAIKGSVLIVPNFLEAQEATATDRARAQAYRERKRAEALEPASRNVTAPSQNVTPTSRAITERHAATESSLCAVPSRTVPSHTVLKEQTPGFDFVGCYDSYPRKEGRKKGLERLRKSVTTPERFEAFKLAIANYRAKLAADGTEPRFIKHFDSFVGCWEDYLAPVEKPTSPTPQAPAVRRWNGAVIGMAPVEPPPTKTRFLKA